jgi:hypothetical protein
MVQKNTVFYCSILPKVRYFRIPLIHKERCINYRRQLLARSKIGLERNSFYNFRENSRKFVNFHEIVFPREIVQICQSLRNISRKSAYCYHFQETKIFVSNLL